MASEEKQTTTIPSSDDATGGDRGDLISGLCDDVLLRILGLVDNAKFAARTGVLSRRWRGLWTRVPALRFFAHLWWTQDVEAERFIAFVNNVLSRRAQSEETVERLAFCLCMGFTMRGQRQDLSVVVSESWIRHALQHGVKSFHLDLHLYRSPAEDEQLHVMDLSELPSSAKTETLSLALDRTRVKLPASTVVFASLKYLTFDRVEVAGDSVLARFLSSACCPNLKKLRMHNVWLAGSLQLLIEATALSELSLEGVCRMTSLELRTPGLRVLLLQSCNDLETLIVKAPKMEDFAFLCKPDDLISIEGDLSGVRSLKVDLTSYEDEENFFQEIDMSIFILQRCRSARCLAVDFDVPMRKEHGVDIIIQGLPPQLRRVTSLKIFTCNLCEWHSYGDGIASLLTTFTNLTYLCLNFSAYYSSQSDGPSISDHPADDWRSHEISLVKLHKAEFMGLRGTDCELQFLQSVLSTPGELEKVTIDFRSSYNLGENRRRDFRHKLLGDGTWIYCHDAYHQSYEWRPCR